jgi:hypothetical protein
MSTVNVLLDKLTKIKSEDTISIKLPSTGKDFSFNSISVKQQKNLLKHAMDGGGGIVPAFKEMNSIIFDNIVDKTAEISVVDKYPILIALRKKSLGNNIKIEDKPYDLTELPSFVKLPKSLTAATVDCMGIKVSLSLPSLQKDTEYLNKVISEVKKAGDDKAKETVAVMYTYEIVKFIESITFSEGTINFSDITIQDRKAVVENLPVELNQQILNFINKVREFENAFITFSDNVVVPINTLFLTGE